MDEEKLRLKGHPVALWDDLRFVIHLFFFVSFSSTGLSSGLSIAEDYGSSKSSGTVSHQSLPAFSQPFGARSYRYSPPYATSQQNTTGTAGAVVDATSWTYASPTSDPLTTQYGSFPKRQTVNSGTAPTQLSAAASLTASESILFFSLILQLNIKAQFNTFFIYDRAKLWCS